MPTQPTHPTSNPQPPLTSPLRPALTALNQLNSKLQSDHKYTLLQSRIQSLQTQRQGLYEYIEQLKEQLELEKRLRVSWEKRNNSAKMVDHQKVREQLEGIKAKKY